MKLSKEEIEKIVYEELHEILGLKNLLKRKEKKGSEEDELALSALSQFSPETRAKAKDIEVTGYRDFATKEKSAVDPLPKSRSYSLEEEEDIVEVQSDK